MKYIQLFLFLGLIYSCNEEQKKEENSETSKGKKELVKLVSLGFYETYELSQIRDSWIAADELSKNQEGYGLDTSSTDDLSFDEEPSSSLASLANLLLPIPYSVAIGYAKNDQDKAKISSILNRSDIKVLFDAQLSFKWGVKREFIDYSQTKRGWYLYACRVPENGKAKVNESHISKATTGYDDMNGDITVNLSMTDAGADAWSRMTSENLGRIIAITINDVVYSAPVVRTAITGGNTQISGNFTFDEANELVELLNGDD